MNIAYLREVVLPIRLYRHKPSVLRACANR